MPPQKNLSGLGEQGHFDATGLTPSMGAVAQVPAPSPGKGVPGVLLPEKRISSGSCEKKCVIIYKSWKSGHGLVVACLTPTEDLTLTVRWIKEKP